MEADQHSGMDTYVHLSFTMKGRMQYVAQKDGRITDIVWLRIDPTIIKLPGVRMTAEVSNQQGVVPKDVDEALRELDLEVIYQITDAATFKQRIDLADEYEIFVPNLVPIEYIQNPNG